jgi:hypothetical protein
LTFPLRQFETLKFVLEFDPLKVSLFENSRRSVMDETWDYALDKLFIFGRIGA